jgi:integrase
MLALEFFDSVYRVKRLKPTARNTCRLYLESLKRFDLFLGRRARLDDLTAANIERLMADCLRNGNAAATANKHRDQLLAMARYAHRLGLLADWPDTQRYEEPERAPQAWLADDVERLLEACRQQPGSIGRAPASVWWLGLVSVAFDSGERIGAILGVRWDDLEGRWLLARAELRKGGKRDRRYLLSETTAATLKELRTYTRDSGVVFHWPYSYTYVWRRYSQVLESAGLPVGRRSGFHRIRKTVASVAHAAGLDAQSLLDHSHKRTTQRYLDPRFTRQEQPSEVLARYLADPSLCHRDRHLPESRQTG